MSNNDNNRLDRIEALLESTAVRVESIAAQQEQSNKKIDSNARAIEALTQDISRFSESVSQLTEDTSRLIEESRQQNRRIEQLIGYSITGESERLNLEQRVRILEQKFKRLEEQEN